MKYKQEKPKRQHAMTRKIRSTGFVCCRYCGLVNLNNEATRRAINRGCLDPEPVKIKEV